MKVKTIIRGAMLVTLMASTACVPFDTIIIDNGYYDDPFYGPGLPPPPVVAPLPPHNPAPAPAPHKPDPKPNHRPDNGPGHKPDNRPDNKPSVNPSKPNNKPDVKPGGGGDGKRPGGVNTGGSGKRPSNRRH